MKKILIYALILMVGVIGVLLNYSRSLSEQNSIYKANQTALLDSVNTYITKYDHSVGAVQKLTLDYKTLEDKFSLVKATADELNIKLKRTQSASTTATKTHVEIRTEVRDSIVYREGVIDSMRMFSWRDPWTDVRGVIVDDSVGMSIQSTDTLVQIVHRVPHKFWFIKWGTKAIRQEVLSRNPHTKITYTDYIEIK